jgi:hypothetical protein
MGEVKQAEGGIPVADGVQWSVVFQDNQSGKWNRLNSAPATDPHYAGFGKPLAKNRMEAPAKP